MRALLALRASPASFLLLLLLLLHLRGPSLARAEEETDLVAQLGTDEFEAGASPLSLSVDDGETDDDDDDDDWDRVFEEQRRLDAAVETDAAGQPVASYDTDEVVPGLPGMDLSAFNAGLADKVVLERVIDWAYDAVALRSAYKDSFVHAEDLYDLLLKTLVPLESELYAEDYAVLHAAVAELRESEGLLDDDMVIYRGYIARGRPLRFLLELAERMHLTSATTAGRRRLEEL